MYLKNLLPSFFVIIIFTCCNTQPKKADILASNLDTSANPADDFFQYACGGWIKNNPIPGDQSAWGIANLVIEENLKRLQQIAENAGTSKAVAGSAEQIIGDYYKAAMDSAAIEKGGMQPIQPMLDKINNTAALPELISLMAELNVAGVESPITMAIFQDAKNSSQYALHLWQGGIGLPEREYYFATDSSNTAIRAAYIKHISNVLQLSGTAISMAETAAAEIMQLETKLASAHRRLEALRDPYANYNKMALGDLPSMAAAINWPDYFSKTGISKTDSVIVGQPEYYKTLSNLLTSIPLNTWKSYMQYRVVDAFDHALPDTVGKESFSMSKLLSGAKQRKLRWKRVIGDQENMMGELMGKLYVKEYFDTTARNRYSNLVESIRIALKERITRLDWMSDSTKQRAYIKLASISKKVGYPDKWKDFSAMKIEPGSYVQNVINARTWWHAYEIHKLGKPVDKDEWDMFPQTYNAYYNPSNNEIVLPAGIFTVPGYKDHELDDALVYGYAAASTIGHEITHGFDDEGRQFDEKGNLVSWWTKEDEEKFGKKANVMVEQFNGFRVIDSLYINGRATLGENIADMGGILLGWDAFMKTDQYKENKPIGGLTPAQRYFLGYALGWLSHSTPESLRNRVLTDVHSPAKFRVNGPLQDVDAFYKVFNVQAGNKMYLQDTARVRIW